MNTVENYIALLLFVMPGYLARLVYGHLEDGMFEKDKFRIIMESLLYNMAIIPTVYFALVCMGFNAESPNLFFSATLNIAVYAACAVMAAIVAGGAWKFLKPFYVKGINRLRRASDQNTIDLDKSVFDIAFNDGQIHWVEVHREGEMLARGIMGMMYASRGELYVTDEENCISVYTDEQGNPKRYKGTYIDYKNNLTIKEICTE